MLIKAEVILDSSCIRFERIYQDIQKELFCISFNLMEISCLADVCFYNPNVYTTVLLCFSSTRYANGQMEVEKPMASVD